MHHQNGAPDGNQQGPIDQPGSTNCTQRQSGGGSGMAAGACPVAKPGGDSLHAADDAVDRRAADSASRSGGRVGGLRHGANRALKNTHLFAPMPPQGKTIFTAVHPYVNPCRRLVPSRIQNEDAGGVQHGESHQVATCRCGRPDWRLPKPIYRFTTGVLTEGSARGFC